MKIFIAFCALVAVTFAEDALSEVLKSPKATVQLYNSFKSKQHLSFDASEDRMRFRLFRKNAEFVAAANSNPDDTARYAINFFSSLTADEKKQYLGLNITGHLANPVGVHKVGAGFTAPSEKLWVKGGSVTEIKNQGNCGSCWTFGAVGGLETRYQQIAGKLRNFAEQEYLDCTYDSKKNGCRGGWPTMAYDYSAKHGGRLAATKDYKYQGAQGSCKGGSKPDAMVAAKITGVVAVGATEAENIEALASGGLTVAFEVTDYFQQYDGSIMKDKTCRGRPNHAVTTVGYTPKFVLAKNSWGTNWGDSGFVKFARHHGNCGLFEYSFYPTLTKTGVTDETPSDRATKYVPNDNGPSPRPNPTCKDKATNCTKDYCKFDIAETYCAMTCGYCEQKDCPSGTIRCSDGACRHEHMCH